MVLLQDYVSALSGLLEDQDLQEGVPYRLMHFVIQQPVQEGLLLYNVLTRAVVLLTAEEARKMEENPEIVPELVAKWFAVPRDHDDRKLALEVRAVGKMLENPPHGFTNYTIFTTTDCNARCFYCYQRGRSRISMNKETARKVADFIIRNNPGKKIKLRWFGGEPLYNKAAITTICNELDEARTAYTSTMVTNGYLFDDATIAEAVNRWNLKKVQITLDGTAEVYNRSKAFIYPDVNAFQRVLANIHHLLAEGIRIDVRLNINWQNAENLMELADLLTETFGAQKLLRVYSHSLFEKGPGQGANMLTDIQRRELFNTRMRLQEKLQEGKIALIGDLPHKLKLNRCMADRDANVVILPDGHLGKCEHYYEDHWFGHLDSSEKDESMLTDFKRLREETEACAECPFYPECYRLVLCEEAAHCYPEDRQEMLQLTRKQLLNFYRNKRDAVSD